ncbi:SDR family oxidoreductase [Methylotenera versatilis]|uniref:Saccharopine dehydrogenase n=1 Tax=Methylotenera versatilis (strain 301) TaxID=666681 RepID=D7DPK1_METV0|nr:SDR family oxidoreductase [Methylotenera versatilis]ADI29245.1 Saccharopine dehydrogenase [Methylotenera versatilis 301]
MKTEAILIIGAAGNNGVATLESLIQKNDAQYAIRAGVRNVEKGQQLQQQYPSIEAVVINLDAPATLAAAFEGVTKVFIIPGNVENRAQHAKNAIDAAVAAGSVKQVVLYSVVGAEWEAILFARQFREAEKYLEASGLPWTHLRTIWFQENFLGWADGVKQGAFYFGVREGQFAPLNVKDIGEIAANILTTSGHERKAYNVTGPELLSGQNIADTFSHITGRNVAYVSPDENTTLQSLLGAGWPEWQAKGALELFEVFASNQAAVVSPDGEALLGRPLTKLADYLESNKTAFV